MLKRLRLLVCQVQLLLVPFLLIPLVAGAELRVVDDMGTTVTLDSPPQRIVSLAPHVTELLFSLGLGAEIVGTSEYSDFPAAARHILRVGRHDRFDMERILALQPDLVVAWKSGNGVDVIQRLRELGLTVFAAESTTLESVPELLEKLGALTGTRDQAGRKATAYRDKLSALSERYQQRSPVRVFFQLWQEPLITLAADQYITDAIRRCGGRNVFANLAGTTATVSKEAVLAQAPELILATGPSSGSAGATRPLEHWRSLGGIPAVNYGLLTLLPPDTLARPTLRLISGMTHLCQTIQGARLKLNNGEHQE
jgi:iron complex transport system substrate-binding protein